MPVKQKPSLVVSMVCFSTEMVTSGAVLDDEMWCVQAAYTLCNIAAHGNEFCSMLLDEGVLKEVIPLFRSTDTDTVHYALSLCEMLLHSSSDVSLTITDQ